MKEDRFELLDDESVIWSCVEPILNKIANHDAETKARVLAELNDGQRALFLFQLLYGYANHGVKQLYSEIEELSKTADIFPGIKAGMEYFGDSDMLALVSVIEKGFHEATDDPENQSYFQQLDRFYQETVPMSVKLIADYIKANPAEFVDSE